jgi:hypothetical protein
LFFGADETGSAGNVLKYAAEFRATTERGRSKEVLKHGDGATFKPCEKGIEVSQQAKSGAETGPSRAK